MLERNYRTSRLTATYYEQVIRTLITCNAQGLKYKAVADELNAQNLTSPTGLPWSAEIVKQIMKKLRSYSLYPSRIHSHLTNLVFEGKLSVKEALPLFKPRWHDGQ